MAKLKLREICHSRAGDKGDASTLSLIVYNQANYGLIEREVTAAKVKGFFKEIVKGEVERYELPQLGALSFKLNSALGGGASRSTRIDGHGKSLSSILLSLEIEKPE